MRLVTFLSQDEARVGVPIDGGIAATRYASMLEFIADGAAAVEHAGQVAEEARRSGASTTADRLLSPLPRPSKLLFCGRNYADHIAENPASKLPESPFFFSKLPTTVIGPGDEIRLPYASANVDYEAELAIIIAKAGKAIPRDGALDYVFGYSIVNDVSARKVQFTDNQITLGKSFDTFCPMGPEIVLRDEVPDPNNLTLSTYVNGVQKQHASTSSMIFDPAYLISFLSEIMTLEPGDVISTGTPAGVGCFRDPPEYLQPGDEVAIEIDGIGRLTNPVVAGW